MRDYKKWQRARLPLVREVLILGFSDREASRLVGCCQQMIAADRRSLGLPSSKEQLGGCHFYLYLFAFHRYAQLSTARRGEVNENLAKLRDVLCGWLGIDEVMTLLRNAEAIMATLSVPGHTPAQEPYLRFLQMVFKEPKAAATETEEDTGPKRSYNIWRAYLESVASDKMFAPPSLQVVKDEMLKRYLAEGRQCIIPVWPKDAVGLIEKALGESSQLLSPRREKLIRQYFGLDCERPTLIQLAEAEGVTSERIRQMNVESCRRLRH